MPALGCLLSRKIHEPPKTLSLTLSRTLSLHVWKPTATPNALMTAQPSFQHGSIWIAAILTAAILGSGPGASAQPPQKSPAPPSNSVAALPAPRPAASLADVELRGRLICIPEEMHRLYQTELAAGHEHIRGLKTTNGLIYTLVRVRAAEALFADPALAGKDLLIKGRVFPGTQVFEPTRLQSVKSGKIYDLYYWCSTCSIRAIEPGECMCCRGPMELKETPAE